LLKLRQNFDWEIGLDHSSSSSPLPLMTLRIQTCTFRFPHRRSSTSIPIEPTGIGSEFYHFKCTKYVHFRDDLTNGNPHQTLYPKDKILIELSSYRTHSFLCADVHDTHITFLKMADIIRALFNTEPCFGLWKRPVFLLLYCFLFISICEL
jgi:hypothetical protein